MMFDDAQGFYDSEGKPVGIGLWPDREPITPDNSYFDTVVVAGRTLPRLRRVGYKEDCRTKEEG